MSKSTKAILSGLVPVVNSLLAKNTSKVKNCIDKFINERNKFIFDTCPCDRIYYTEADAEMMFSAIGIDKETVQKYLKDTYYFAMAAFNPRAAKDELTVLMMCAIRYYYIVKKDMKMRDLCMIYLAFSGKFYPSLHYSSYPKVQPSEYRHVMEYVVNNMLSDKFYLKTEGTVFGAIKKFGVTWLEAYKSEFTSFADEEIVYLIQQLHNRIKTFMKNVATLYYEAYENKDYMTYDSDSFEQGDFHLADSDSLKAERYIEKAMNKINTSSVEYKYCKMCSDANVKTEEIRSIIETILQKQEYNLEVKELIRLIVYTFFEHNESKDVTDIRFISYTIAPKPNTTDKHLIKIKTLVESWLDNESLNYRKRKNREATKNSYYRSILLYFVLVIHNSNK